MQFLGYTQHHASSLMLLLVQGQALIFNAAAEVGVGFLLLIALVSPQRQMLLTFVYWKNFLPTRYHTPDAAGYHRQVRNALWLIELHIITYQQTWRLGHGARLRGSAASTMGASTISMHSVCSPRA